ncbi:hypothetical protein HXA31_07960 [Salipaludibacillus agaradhaerens]|uniref:Uncharacterized protein n=1 Tax=Salipaludibacillus agaradhaerens TaxID=76935 RepID=A0A9Q4B0Y1_SALAG|nr:hypothetical protein [Salipaludibacillus agaradhaerens]MCR6096140.1 hypothetical protein [Salipaludibacillus agaradhaerens]MCR6114301.1 hypothetical protein [Salipaludibacillus agaradhaerens]
MKRLILIVFVVSFSFPSSVSISKYHEGLEIDEDYIKLLEEPSLNGFIIEEENNLSKIDLQLKKLKTDIERMSTLNDSEQDVYEYLKGIDFHEIIEEEEQILEEQLAIKRDLINPVDEKYDLTIEDLEFPSISDKYDTTELLDVEVTVYVVDLESESEEYNVYELSDYVEEID